MAVAEGEIWTPEQMTPLLDSVADHRPAGCFALTLPGLRREEVGGRPLVRPRPRRGELRIRHARVDVNGRDVVGDPKSARSVRDLPIPPRELAMVKAMRTAYFRERMAVGRPLAEGALILARIDESPLVVRDYTRLFTTRRMAAKLRRSRCASSDTCRSPECGRRDPADVVAAWHGHSERMTTAVYGRVSDDRLKAASEVFSKAVGNS